MSDTNEMWPERGRPSALPNHVYASRGVLTKLKAKAELSKTALVQIVFQGDSNTEGYNGTNAQTFFEAWTSNKIDMGLQSWRDNVDLGPQSKQSSCIEIKLVPPGIDPVNGYTEAPWHPSRSTVNLPRKWYGDLYTNPGGLGQLFFHDQHAMLSTLGGYGGFIVDRTSTGEKWESNKTKASIVYAIRGGNPDVKLTSAGNVLDSAGVSHASWSAPDLYFSPFMLELVDITAVVEANYGTAAAYSSQIIDPVYGVGGGGHNFGARSPFSGTITDGIKTLVRFKPYANTAQKLTVTSFPITLEYGGSTSVVASGSTTNVQNACDALMGAGKVKVNNINTNVWIINSLPSRWSGGGTLTPLTISAGVAVVPDVSGGSFVLGLTLDDAATTGPKMHDIGASGGREGQFQTRLHDDNGTVNATNGVSPGMYTSGKYMSYASRIGMFIENPYAVAADPRTGTYTNSAGNVATPPHNAVGLDILMTALFINAATATTWSVAYVKAKYMDVAAMLDPYTGNNAKILMIVIPPCPETALAGTRDDYYTLGTWAQYRAAAKQVQAAYPNTVVVIDLQEAYGDVAPSVMKARYGKAGYGRGAGNNATNPFHFDNAQYGDYVASSIVDTCTRLSYLLG